MAAKDQKELVGSNLKVREQSSTRGSNSSKKEIMSIINKGTAEEEARHGTMEIIFIISGHGR